MDVVSKNSDHSGAQTPLSETSSTTDMASDTEVPAILSQGLFIHNFTNVIFIKKKISGRRQFFGSFLSEVVLELFSCNS